MLTDCPVEEQSLVADSQEKAQELVQEFGRDFMCPLHDSELNGDAFAFKLEAFDPERLFSFMQKEFLKTPTSPAKKKTVLPPSEVQTGTGRGGGRMAKLPSNTIVAKVS